MTMRRMKTEPSVFWEITGKSILMIVHVDDLLILGCLKFGFELFAEFKLKILLKLVGVIKENNQKVSYVGRTLTYVENGYTWSGGTKLVKTILEEMNLEQAKFMATPAARQTRSLLLLINQVMNQCPMLLI